MYRDKKRFGQDASVVVRSKPGTFNRPLSTAWAEPATVFTCSWSDFFIKEADEWRPEAWDIIRRTQHLTYLILTKRPERGAECLPGDWGDGWSHVWIGVTAEDQKRADERIPLLLQIPAAKRFVSIEPMLGPIALRGVKLGLQIDWTHAAGDDLSYHPITGAHGWWSDYGSMPGDPPKLDWVIVGGESGPKARPMHPEWARSIRDQCIAAGVPFFFKQWGEWGEALNCHIGQPGDIGINRPGELIQAETVDSTDRKAVGEISYNAVSNDGKSWVKLRRVGKKTAGRELDGRTWEQTP
jgi:protein gp37